MTLSRRHRKLFLWIGGVVCALFAGLACLLVRTPHAPQSIANILKEVGFDQRLGANVPLDIVFRDEEDREVVLRDLVGKRPVVLSFVYYRCPMLCTQVVDGLVHSLRAMNLEPGNDFELVTVSIDARDTSERAAAKKASSIAEYGRPDAAAHWHFLTSPAAPSSTGSTGSGSSKTSGTFATSSATGDSAARLAASVGFRYFYDERAEQFAHASGIVVLTPTGEVSKYFYGIDYSPRDLRLALVEASSGTIGSWMDQALLLCYHYDPTTGAYGLVILTIIRAFGGLTVVLLAALVISLVRHERRALRVQAGGS
jgi:protein SCO1/2